MTTTIDADLIPDLYTAADRVSQGLLGLIPAVSTDISAERAAKNQKIRWAKTTAVAGEDIAASQIAPDTGDYTLEEDYISITKERAFPVRHTGTEQMQLNTSVGYKTVLGQQFEQAMKAAVDEVEEDLAALYAKASRAVVPAGTTLFDAANFKDLANCRKELNRNGAPVQQRQLVLSNDDAAKLLGNATNSAANSAGEIGILKQGILADRMNFAIRESNSIADHTEGTAAGAKTDATGYAVGTTTITLGSDGTGTILAGDIIYFDSDTANQYVVLTGDADVSGGGSIVIAEPGLKAVLSAAQHTITVVEQSKRNMAFSKDAIGLVVRTPACPIEGDLAVDNMIVTDPRSGLSFDVRMYMEHKRVRYSIELAWGVKVIKPEHLILLCD